MIWFAVWMGIKFLAWGIHLAKNGEPKHGRYSFFAFIIASCIDMFIMYMWGAFDHIIQGLQP